MRDRATNLSLLAKGSLLGVMAATPLWAQVTPATTQLDEVTLYTDRQGKPLREATQSVDVVTDETLKAKNIDDLESLTRNMPGLSVSRQVSAADPFGGQTGIQIRGVEGNRVQFQIDGARMPERIIDGSRDYLDFNFTKQAEVLRGPASVLWGADALGGVVALRTISAEDVIVPGETRGVQATLGFSSLDKASNGSIALGQKLSENLSLLVAQARGQNSEMRLKHAPADGGAWPCTRPVAYGSVDCGQFNPLDRVSNRTLLKLGYDIDEAQTLTFSLDRLRRESTVDIRTALGPSATGELLENHRRRDVKRTRYGIDYEGSFDKGWIDSLSASLSYSPSGYVQRGAARTRLTSGEHQTQHDTLRYGEDFFELDLQAKSSFQLGGAEHKLTWGLDADRAKTTYDVKRSREHHSTGVVTPVAPGGFNFTDGTTTRADLYVQDEISLMNGALTLTPGLRFASYRMDPRLNSSVNVTNPGFYEKKRETKLLKSMGAVYKLNDSHSVWAHYSEGFKMPTFQQLFTSSVSGSFDLVPAPWLQPEAVKSFELGLRGDYGDAAWSINAFKADYTDFIESFWFVPGTNDISYRNLSQVRTWGIEAEGHWQASNALRLNGSLAWMQGRAKADATARETIHVVPPLSGSIGADYAFAGRDLVLSANLLFAGAVKSKPGNFAPSGYGVVDVAAKWGLSPHATLNLGVNNLFDRAYYTQGAAGSSLSSTSATTATVPPGLYTGAGRNVTLSLDMRF